MKHITILYGPDSTGKQFVLDGMGWVQLNGTPDEMKATLNANLETNEFGVCILQDAEETRDIRVVVHEHARANGYVVRYIDFRI